MKCDEIFAALAMLEKERGISQSLQPFSSTTGSASSRTVSVTFFIVSLAIRVFSEICKRKSGPNGPLCVSCIHNISILSHKAAECKRFCAQFAAFLKKFPLFFVIFCAPHPSRLQSGEKYAIRIGL